jgi:hypothetical protein
VPWLGEARGYSVDEIGPGAIGNHTKSWDAHIHANFMARVGPTKKSGLVTPARRSASILLADSGAGSSRTTHVSYAWRAEDKVDTDNCTEDFG